MDTCIPIAIAHPHVYYFGSNEVPDLPEAHQRIEAGLKMGAVIIGEQKFDVPVDSPAMEVVYSLAQEYNVPVLMHFQYETFNTGYEAARQSACEMAQGHLHWACRDVLGEHRCGSGESQGGLSEGTGESRGADGSLPERSPEFLRRPLCRLRAQRAGA